MMTSFLLVQLKTRNGKCKKTAEKCTAEIIYFTKNKPFGKDYAVLTERHQAFSPVDKKTKKKQS
jgi:hypothetical protein